MSDSIAVIIPAFNEADTIGSIVREVVELGYPVFVVDDCSDDSTCLSASEAGAEVISLKSRSGAWKAIQKGLMHACMANKYNLFVTMDADGQHKPADISRLYERYKKSGVNVAIGSCVQRGSRARKLVWKIFYLMTRLKIRDMTSGFKLYDRKAVEVLLSPKADSFDYQDLGPLLLLRRHKISFYESSLYMPPRSNGCSRVFNSWFSVFVYLFRTSVLICSDWVSGAVVEDSDEQRSYDHL